MDKNTIEENIAESKRHLLNKILVIFNILVILAVAGSMIRSIDIGWRTIMTVQVIIAIVFTLITLYRDKLSFEHKTRLIIGLLFIAALGGLITFGLAGANIVIWVFIPILSASLIGFNFARSCILISIASFCIIGYLFVSGSIHANFDANQYITSGSAWIALVLSFPLFSYMAVLIISNINTINNELLIEIDTKRKDLEKLNSVKDTLFSMISHDLRTPFMGLIGGLEIIHNDELPLNNADTKKIIGMLLESSKNTHAMLENLLVWASAEMNEIPLSKKPIPLQQSVQEACKPYLKTAQEKDIQIDISIPDELTILGDNPSFKIIFSNFLSNAIKFSLPKSRITITAEAIAGDVILHITDFGVGMTDENRQALLGGRHMFTTYGTANEKGVGLGIRVCLQLIQKNGGKLDIQSFPGQGSTFSITFPAPGDS